MNQHIPRRPSHQKFPPGVPGSRGLSLRPGLGGTAIAFSAEVAKGRIRDSSAVGITSDAKPLRAQAACVLSKGDGLKAAKLGAAYRIGHMLLYARWIARRRKIDMDEVQASSEACARPGASPSGCSAASG
jgi:hypothetical protein